MKKFASFFLMFLMVACTTKKPSGELPPMFPFLVSYEGADNATGMAHLLDPPAGKHGFVRVEKGHFATDAGPIRFHATNLTGPANFPSHEAADKLAERLARLGINCVRHHFMDTWYINFMPQPTQGILADSSKTQRDLDPNQLDKLDYLISAFKKRGIYSDLNLHVGRTLDKKDGFINSDKLPTYNKGVNQFEPRMIELQKEYATKLLTHVNPYTGNPYSNEPCIAMIEITNENSLMNYFYNGFYSKMPDPYQTELRNQWNKWIRKTYNSAAKLQESWKWKPGPLSSEQIPEGKFDNPVSFDGGDWSLQKGTAEAVVKTEEGVLKLDVTKNGEEYFPKLFRKISLKKGQIYTLSFKIRRLGDSKPWQLSLSASTHQGGWRSLGIQELLPVGAEWKTITRVFESAEDNDNASLQFTQFNVGKYEIEDLSFKSGAVEIIDPSKEYASGKIPLPTMKGQIPPVAFRDFQKFMEETETNYWMGMYEHIKKNIKAQSPVSGTQLGYSPPHVQAMLDYVDIHGYWRHPTGGWISLTAKEPWAIGNDAMVNTLSNINNRLAIARVNNKPYTVSEYNHPYPNQFGAEAQPMLSIYGRLQGWDGIFQYSYNHYVNDWEPEANPWCFFDCIARTDVLAHFPACAAMFLRGDVSEARESVIPAVDMEDYLDYLADHKTVNFTTGSLGIDNRLSLIHKTALDFSGTGIKPADAPTLPKEQKIITSDTDEITWNTEIPNAAYLSVNTPNTKFFTGFPEGRTIALGNVELKIGKTSLNWATVSLVSRFATGFGDQGKPSTVLVAITGDSGNSGRVVKQLEGEKITLTDRGTAPVLVEGIPATLIIPSDPEKTTCFALDGKGNRTKEVPVKKCGKGGSRVELDPGYQTIWYEIEIK